MYYNTNYRKSRKKVFVSFDYDHDKNYKYLLEAWDENPDFEFVFTDLTPDEIQTNDIGRIKAVLTARINQSTHTLVLVGKYANTRHKDADKIGYKNWINFEVHQSKVNKNKIIAVLLDIYNQEPDEFKEYAIKRVYGFKEKAIIDALNSA
jgi:hypothetical protein